MTESYQGVGGLPARGIRQEAGSLLQRHDIVMIFDEVQAGFGRTGKMFCFEHYGISLI